MTTLKVANVGDEYIGQVDACEVMKGQFGEQVRFTFGGDQLFLPKASADGQLKRAGFVQLDDDGVPVANGPVLYSDVVGETLKFWRTPNTSVAGAKPYWNAAVATPADLKAKPVSKRVAPPADNRTAAQKHFDEEVPPLDDQDAPQAPAKAPRFIQEAVQEAAEAVDQAQAQRDAIERAYAALATRVAARQRARYESDLGEAVPYDGSSVQAETATVWIAWKDLGLTRSLMQVTP